ncbi:hypothetical protein BO78DRAFT_273661, partial [Aspergillus sclerotiicarbonarius CBS 121057]
PSSELALVQEYPPIPFSNLRSLKRTIEAKLHSIEEGDENVHISVNNVTAADLDSIEKYRDRNRPSLRLTFFDDISTLIIKCPSKMHDKACGNLGSAIFVKLTGMGVSDYNEFYSLLSGRHETPSWRKEGDGAWKNLDLRPSDDAWPHLVIEAGLAESLPRLRVDAKWWIENSKGEVQIVLIIQIKKQARRVLIEKYIPTKPSSGPMTRSRTAGRRIITQRVSEISIDHSTNPPVVQGAPLVLEFQRVIGRAPQPPERDIVV